MGILFDGKPLVISPFLAKAIGLNEAIVLQQVHYWLENNKKNNCNLIDGRYWTYKSISNWHEEYFTFWSEKTVKRTFANLEQKGVLVIGNYNKLPYDKTKWYSIDYILLESLIADCPNGKGQNDPIDRDKMTQPIQENIKENIKENKEYVHPEECTSENSDIEKSTKKDINTGFESLWSLYPKKRGKGSISDATKKRLCGIGYDEIKRCIERYCKECQGIDMQFVQMGSTFFNSGYVDYLDINYSANTQNIAKDNSVNEQKSKTQLEIERRKQEMGWCDE